MIKREATTGRSITRVDLSLPIVQTDSYEIFYAVPASSQHSRATIPQPQKSFSDIHNKKFVNSTTTTRLRSPARLKHPTGPVFVNLLSNTSPLTAESISLVNEANSNSLRHSAHSNRTLKSISTVNKSPKPKSVKDDSNQSRTSSGYRLVYESLGSFDDSNSTKPRYSNMWINLHHPQLTSAKALHIKRTRKLTSNSSDIQSKISYENLSQESAASINEQLYEKIEELTKNYFPTIQRLRHTRPSPELINNRMHFYREQKRYFMPILSRTRVVR